jgi:hypothetical protein
MSENLQVSFRGKTSMKLKVLIGAEKGWINFEGSEMHIYIREHK